MQLHPGPRQAKRGHHGGRNRSSFNDASTPRRCASRNLVSGSTLDSGRCCTSDRSCRLDDRCSPTGRWATLLVVFALPTALLAVSFGTKGGLAGGAAAMLLSVAWAFGRGSDGIGAGEWAAGTALLVLGVLLGEAIDALDEAERIARQADEGRRHLEQAAEHRREAAAINDTLVQSAAMAKWALEAGNTTRAVEILEEAIECGQRLVTTLINASDAYTVEAAAEAAVEA